jgi:hypothetical protein
MCCGREGSVADEPVAEEIADVAPLGPAGWSRYDIGRLRLEAAELCARSDDAGLRDAVIRERHGRRSLARRILHQVAGEMVRGRLGCRARDEHHQSNGRDDRRQDAMHGTSKEQDMCPPASLTIPSGAASLATRSTTSAAVVPNRRHATKSARRSSGSAPRLHGPVHACEFPQQTAAEAPGGASRRRPEPVERIGLGRAASHPGR